MYTRVCALIIENNKVLLIAHDYEKGRLWHLPGGKTKEQDLSLKDALAREVKEELNLDIEIDELVFVCEERLRSVRHVLQIVFFAHIINNIQPIVNQQESGGVLAEFMLASELPKLNLYPNIGKEIMSMLNGLPKRKTYLDVSSSREWL